MQPKNEEKNKKFDVLYIDFETQYTNTIEHIFSKFWEEFDEKVRKDRL